MAAGGLVKHSQSDFSAGAFRGFSRDEIPGNGAEDLDNFLISDDGLPTRRGGSAYRTPDLKGLFDPLVTYPGQFIWDGELAAGPRTVVANSGALAVVKADDVSLLTLMGALFAARYPAKAAFLNGMLVLPGGALYGGSRNANLQYVDGTATLVPGSDQVVGVGTLWNTAGNADPGMILSVNPPATERVAIVKSIEDDTHLTLTDPWAGAGYAATPDYILERVGFINSATYVRGSIYATVANKLLSAIGDTIYESAVNDPQGWSKTEKVQLPAGVKVLGIEARRDAALIFTTAGVWLLSNVALRLTDALGTTQQRLEQVNRDLILWSWAGIATFGDQFVVPATDGVYLFDGISGPRLVSDGVAMKYREYVKAGYRTGGAAIMNNTYFLPIINGAGVVVDQVVCRLAPTRRGNGQAGPAWTRNSGAGANMGALALRVSSSDARQPILLGTDATNGRVSTLSYFDETATDTDGNNVIGTLVTREFGAFNGVRNFMERLRMRYELVGGGATVTAEHAEDTGAYTALAGAAPPAIVTAPKTWQVRKRGYGRRFRLTTTGGATRFVLHMLEIFSRPSGRV